MGDDAVAGGVVEKLAALELGRAQVDGVRRQRDGRSDVRVALAQMLIFDGDVGADERDAEASVPVRDLAPFAYEVPDQLVTQRAGTGDEDVRCASPAEGGMDSQQAARPEVGGVEEFEAEPALRADLHAPKRVPQVGVCHLRCAR